MNKNNPQFKQVKKDILTRNDYIKEEEPEDFYSESKEP